MTSEKSNAANDKPALAFTLKLFFGPMFGCELHLPADDYFIIIHKNIEGGLGVITEHQNNDMSESLHAAEFSSKTLYIPANTDSPNIALQLSKAVCDDGLIKYKVEILSINGSEESFIYENRVFTHHQIIFALKKSEDVWSEEVVKFNFTQNANSAENLSKFHSILKSKKIHKNLIAVALFSLLIVLGFTNFYKSHEYDSELDSVRQLLIGSPSLVTVLRGHDKKNYAIANDYRTYEWLKEAAFKIAKAHKVTPLWVKNIKNKTIEQLRKKGYPVLQLDMSNLNRPVLFIHEYLSESETSSLKSIALNEIVYADNVNIIYRDHAQLLKQARQGLDKLHIYYRQIKTENGYALVVRDALSDHVIMSLRSFINDFYRQWGDNVINFSINLEEDWLQNKSYLNSRNGYLFLGPLHWYFPISKGDI